MQLRGRNMKSKRIICLILCFAVFAQLAFSVSADETETTQPTTEAIETLPEPPVQSVYLPEGEDGSVTNGCRTVDGQMPLWGKNKILHASGAAMLYEINSDTMVYSWNADESKSPASLVKIMTCLVAVEKGNIADTITISERSFEALPSYAHTLELKVGEIVTLEQMLYCMMVGSANDAAAVIATHIGGSEAAFVAMMNQKAKDIGCTGTNFTNSTGIGHSDQYTTARDMVKIVKYAIQNELFFEFFSATLYTLKKTNMSEARQVTTSNYLMTPGMIAFYDSRVTGGRTGITDDQKRCLIATAEKGELKYIAVVLEAVPTYNKRGTSITNFGSYEEIRELLNKGFADHHIVQVLREDEILRQYSVLNGANHLVVGPTESVITVLPSKATTANLTVRYVNGSEVLTAPVQKGDTVATVQLWYGNVCIAQSPVTARNSVEVYVAEDEDDSPIANADGLTKALVIVGIILGVLLSIAAVMYLAQVFRRLNMRAQHRRRRKSRRRSR